MLLCGCGEGRREALHIAGNDRSIMAPNEAGEDIAMRRRRMRWRAWHRGTRELDLILGPFADARAEGFGAEELTRFEALMSEEDTDILQWAMGQAEMPATADRALMDEIKSFIGTK
jgi:antitoxin CptB